MSMTCRRCDGRLDAGEIANVIRGLVVGECCRLPAERGYADGAGDRMPSPPVVEAGDVLAMTERRLEILRLASPEVGLVTRSGNVVNAFDPRVRRMRDSKSVVEVLRKADLVFWERLPPAGFEREMRKWKLCLTADGFRVRDEWEMEAARAARG